MKILAMNFGSTSSKFALFSEEKMLARANVSHDRNVIQRFKSIFDQVELRRSALHDFLREQQLDFSDLDCIITRGGHWQPVPSGVLELNQAMIDDVRSGKWGVHAADVGVIMAYELAKEYDIPAISADAAITDEFEPLARFSGLKAIARVSSFHVLNHKAVAKRYAKEYHLSYPDLNLIVIHLGGGISVAAHQRGRMIDANNALDGEGPFSPERAGSLPAGALVQLCFSGEHSLAEVQRMLAGGGGLVSYLGTSDLLEVEAMISAGNTYAEQVRDAMVYQCAKAIAEMAAVLKGEVDQIIFTGSMAYSETLTSMLKSYVEWIAPVTIYPGEDEMQAMAEHARNFLNKTVVPLQYPECRVIIE